MRFLFLHKSAPQADTKLDIFKEQVINSAIIAGIAGVATWTGVYPDLLTMSKAFIITFLVELRKYRNI